MTGFAMYCLDCGQGAAAALIDPIPGRRDEFQAVVVDVGVDGKKLAEWLKGSGVERIVAVVLTHNDLDHVRGLPGLVSAFRSRVGKVWLPVDRKPPLPPHWLKLQEWASLGWVRQVERLEAPAAVSPGLGTRLVGPPDAGYSLHCIHPTIFSSEAAAHGAEFCSPVGRGPNASSGVLRMSTPTATAETRILWGGDLDYRGWKNLVDAGHDLRAKIFVVPHHGGPAYGDLDFGPAELAAAVDPKLSLFSVGTANRNGHPHPKLVAALSSPGRRVVCTQITPACRRPPKNVLSRNPDDLAFARGAACGGTVVVKWDAEGRTLVRRLQEHQHAVDGLRMEGTPLCRN